MEDNKLHFYFLIKLTLEEELQKVKSLSLKFQEFEYKIYIKK